MEEIDYIVQEMRDKFSNNNKEVKVIHSEAGLMHTVQLGKTVYKAVKLNEKWNFKEWK